MSDEELTRKRIADAERTLYATEFPAKDVGQILKRLRDADGTQYDCAILGWESCQMLLAEIERLRTRKCDHQLAKECGESVMGYSPIEE